jgi:ATP synthase subunit 6
MLSIKLKLNQSTTLMSLYSPLEHFDLEANTPWLMPLIYFLSSLFFIVFYTIFIDVFTIAFRMYHVVMVMCHGEFLTTDSIDVLAYIILNGLTCTWHGVHAFDGFLLNYISFAIFPVYFWLCEIIFVDVRSLFEIIFIVLPNAGLYFLQYTWYFFKLVYVYSYVHIVLIKLEFKFFFISFPTDLRHFITKGYDVNNYSVLDRCLHILVGFFYLFFFILANFKKPGVYSEEYFGFKFTFLHVLACRFYLMKFILIKFNSTYFEFAGTGFLVQLLNDLILSDEIIQPIFEILYHHYFNAVIRYLYLNYCLFYSMMFPDLYLFFFFILNAYYVLINAIFIDLLNNLYVPAWEDFAFKFVALKSDIGILTTIKFLICSESLGSVLEYVTFLEYYDYRLMYPKTATDRLLNGLPLFLLFIIGNAFDYQIVSDFFLFLYNVYLFPIVFEIIMFFHLLFYYIVYYYVMYYQMCKDLVYFVNHYNQITPRNLKMFIQAWPLEINILRHFKIVRKIVFLENNSFTRFILFEICLIYLFGLLISKQSTKIFNKKEFNYYALFGIPVIKNFVSVYIFSYINSKSNFLNYLFQKPYIHNYLTVSIFYSVISDKFLFLVYKIPYLLIKDQFYNKYYFSFYFVLFYYILINNLLCLFPNSFCITGQLVITLTLSCTYFIGLNIIALIMYGFSFYRFFIPKNVPLFLLWLLIIIEVFSYYSRCLSLGIRLFANLMAGHTLINILISFSNYFFYVNKILPFFIVLIILPLFIFAIFLLEIGVAFLQAYVFLMLSLLYAKDIFNFKHGLH